MVYGYIAVSVLSSLVSFVLGFMSLRHKVNGSILLGMTGICAGMVSTLYCLSVFQNSHMAFSVLSSCCFVCIDLMLLSLLGFSLTINTPDKTPKINMFMAIATFIPTVADSIHLLLNPFLGLTLGYEYHPGVFPRFEYVMHPLYYVHLAFSYVMVSLSLLTLILKSRRIPKEYRGTYRYTVISIILILMFNALFLFVKGDSLISRVDVSTLTYSVVVAFMYWSFYRYSSKGMMNIFKMAVFDNLDRALLLFAYDKRMILHNSKADELFPDCEFTDIALDDFGQKYQISLSAELQSNYSTQCYLTRDGKSIPMRCDYKVVRNSEKEILGYLLMFTDAAAETDILTGFQNWDSFQTFAENDPHQFSVFGYVVILDINALAVINSTFGRDEGDKRIKDLSDIMQMNFPNGTYFVRGHDAHLIAICDEMEEDSLRKIVEKISFRFNGSLQYAISSTKSTQHNVLDAISEANKAMRTKKLLDDNSAHSEILSTLVKALEECDTDTKQHVQRTREMGARLGRKIGLSDIQLSNLSLLCLLHDIGKIGIPLEILNKPGKLTDEEWVIMRSHTEKGYQIAQSSKELGIIADMVRHHHERWDGKGYPDGLAGEKIPLLSRMIAVIDSYDAMVNDRIYRPAMSKEAAVAEMQRCAGTQFDPHIVEEFVSLLNEQETEGSVVDRKYFQDSDLQISGKHMETISTIDFSRYYLDAENLIVEVDDAFTVMTGYTREEAVGVLHQVDLIPEEERVMYQHLAHEHLAEKPIAFFEHRIQKKNGECIVVLCLGQVYEDTETGEVRSMITIANIMQTQMVKSMVSAEQRRAQRRLRQWEYQYKNDTLTGLMNYATFRSEVESKLITGSCKILILMLDIDKLKGYNDYYGLTKGDEYLVIAAHTLSSLLREEDYACRNGGDEFAAALIFRDDQPDEDIYARAQQIYDMLCASLISADIQFTGISMGAAISDFSSGYEDIRIKAEQMLTRAKREGRNRICCANDEV